MMYTPFPIDTLPSPLDRFVVEAARSVGCDESLVALPLLTGAGSSIGCTRRIVLKPDWRELPILWMLVVALSGCKKSPPFDKALGPLHRRQAKAAREHAAAMEEHNAAMLQYERALSTWKKRDGANPPERPVAPHMMRWIIVDATVEAIAPLLERCPRGLLLARDEASGWLRSFDAYKSGRGADAAAWLGMHRGGPLIVDRKHGDKPTIIVPRAAVWVTGTITPDALRRALGQEHFENGLAARLLLAYPPARQPKWSDAIIDPETLAAVDEVYGRLLGLDFNTGPDGELVPVDVPLTSAAREAWGRFVDEHGEEQYAMGDDPLAAAWSKLEAAAARLALVIHFVRWAANDYALDDPDAVDETSIDAAVRLVRWFGDEAKRVYGALSETEEEREQRELLDLVYRLGGKVTPRDLLRHTRRFATADAAELALTDLADKAYGVWETVATGGRPATRFLLADSPDRPFGGAVDGVDVDRTRISNGETALVSTSTVSTGPENGGNGHRQQADALVKKLEERG